MTSSFEKFKILIWKNWTIQKRNWKSGVFEILLPFLIVLAFTYVKKNIDIGDNKQQGELVFTSEPIETPANCQRDYLDYFKNGVHISPSIPWLTDTVTATLKDITGLSIKTYQNGAALNAFLDNNDNSTTKPLIGIQFDDDLPVSK
jgi:hypothetical protein